MKAAPVACEDNNEGCAVWAKDGQCEANPKYMEAQCQKSCGKCPEVDAPELADPPAGAVDFDTFVSMSELVMVAFGAPWCPWSRKLTPVWEEVFRTVREESLLSQVRYMYVF